MRRIGVVLVAVGVLLVPAAASATSARQDYNRLWHRADRFYGADGQPAPEFRLMAPEDFGSLNTDRSGPVPVVSAKPWVLRELAEKAKDSPNSTGVQTSPQGFRRQAEKALLHEWAHVYQRWEIFDDPPLAEYDAAHFAQALAARLVRPKGQRKLLPLDRSQFGS